MIFIVDESVARERARQTGQFKFWSLARAEGKFWRPLGYSVDEIAVRDWANTQIATGACFRINGCQCVSGEWVWS